MSSCPMTKEVAFEPVTGLCLLVNVATGPFTSPRRRQSWPMLCRPTGRRASMPPHARGADGRRELAPRPDAYSHHDEKP